MQWDIITDGFEIGIVTKVALYLLVIAAIVLIYLIIVNVRDSWKMKRQLKLWLEKGEQPPQPAFITAEDWAAMMPIKWTNQPVWESFFNSWIRPQFDLSRKAKVWAIFSILIGLGGTIIELMNSFQMLGVVGKVGIASVSFKIAEALIPFLFALVLGLFFHLLAAWADSRIANWKKRMLDAIKKSVTAEEPAGRLP